MKNGSDSTVQMHDFTTDAELLMKTIQAFKSKIGLTKIILCIRGSKTSDATKNKELHGKGKHKTENWWKAVGEFDVLTVFHS